MLGPGAMFSMLYNKYKYSVQFVDDSQCIPDQKHIDVTEESSKSGLFSKSKLTHAKSNPDSETYSKRKDEMQIGNSRKKFRLSFKGKRRSKDTKTESAQTLSSNASKFQFGIDKTDSFNFVASSKVGEAHMFDESEDLVDSSLSMDTSDNTNESFEFVDQNDSSDISTDVIATADNAVVASDNDVIATDDDHTDDEILELKKDFGADFVNEIQHSFDLQRLTSVDRTINTTDNVITFDSTEIEIRASDSVNLVTSDSWFVDKGLMVFSKKGLIHQKKVGFLF